MQQPYRSYIFATKEGQKHFKKCFLDQPLPKRIERAQWELQYWHALDTTDQYFAADIARLKHYLTEWEQQLSRQPYSAHGQGCRNHPSKRRRWPD